MKREKIKRVAALSYTEDMTAPKIIASGKGKVAENILKEAEKNNIAVYQDPKLATILTELEIGSQIPEELYELVAKIMVFVGDMDELYSKTKNARK
jgi:flagellar biosynthesis protein